MLKSAGLSLYYLFLLYLMQSGTPSAFVMLFSLMMELVLMIFVFAVFSYITPDKKDTDIAWRVMVGSFPVLILQFTFAWMLSSSLHEFMPDRSLGPWAPIIAFSTEIGISFGSLLVIYGLNVYEYIKQKSTIEVIKRGLVFQALLISLTGLTGVLILGLTEQLDKMTIITAMAAARLLFEYLVNWKLNYLFKE